MFAAERVETPAPRRIPVPWFALPAASIDRPAGLALAVERAGDGSVVRVQAQVPDAPVAPAE